MKASIRKTAILFLFWGIFCGTSGLGSQGLLDELDVMSEPANEWVRATFKDTRIVNAQSNETPAAGMLHFVIAHQFGQISDGIYTLWGLDNAWMRLGLDFGINDRLAVGLARSTFQKTLEANVKAKLIRQSTGSVNFPLSVTWYSVGMMNGLRWEEERENLFSSRLSYVHQLILTRKMGSDLSLACIPSITHRNLVPSDAVPHDVLTLGLGGRYKLNNRLSINGEWHPFISEKPHPEAIPSLSLGFDIDTGGHVFQLHVTNARGMFERAFLTEAAGRWLDGDLYFGFNLSRSFALKS